MNNKIKLTDFAENQWKDYSLYTLNQRALPSFVDGLKPSQRFILYSAIKNAKDKFIKVVEICGPVSSYGYHHGEASANAACTLMAATWNNNYPLLEGRGNFGSRLIQESAAPRYIFAKLHSNFNQLFTDHHLTPKHDDEEVKIPKYYLPIIPFVLLNGIKGTATGFATNILPYSLKDIVKLCKDHLSGKDISKKKLIPSYPEFNGTIEYNDKDGWDLIGKYEQLGKTKILITELPFQYDRETYVQILDDLEEKEIIVDYVDQCDKTGFKFLVNLKRGFEGDIEKTFKLRKSVSENLNVIDQYGKLKEYSNPIDVIKDFCDFRMGYVDKRIKFEKQVIQDEMNLIKAKIKFIDLVIKNKINFKNKNKMELIKELDDNKFSKEHHDKLLSMNFYHLTLEKIDEFNKKLKELQDQLKYFNSTTAKQEYLIDLDKLSKI